MNLDLRRLLSELAGASGRTKALAALALLALVALVSVAGVVASRPHFTTLYSGLDDAERVSVEKALAEGGLRFRASNFPGPYTIYVDESQFDQAQIQVALAEALRRAPTGINTGESGASTIFMSSGERAQSMLKREWQETENLLSQFEFVLRATVTTSIPDPSVLRKREPLTVSVALNLREGRELSNEQAENVARVVCFRFGVPPENVIVTDQAGRTVFGPSSRGLEADSERLLEHAAAFDRDLAIKVNDALERAFGPDRAYVTVTSDWDSDQSTIIAESMDGEPREREVTKTESRTPAGAAPAPGGTPGTSANLAEGFGVENGATGEPPALAAAESVTKDERTLYDNPRSTTQTVRVVPQLRRLNVGLVVDQSLEAKKDEIRTLVAASVGLDPGRKDVLEMTVTDLAAARPSVEEPAPGEEGGAAEEGPSPTMQVLLQRGVEIVSALAFVVLLFVSLRGARKQDAATTAAAQAVETDAEDPELLARARIEELVKSDPRRVGEILSRWAGEESYARS